MRGVHRAWRPFAGDERGVTTVEWIAIAVVVIIAAFAITTYVMNGASALGGAVGDKMTDAAKDL